MIKRGTEQQIRVCLLKSIWYNGFSPLKRWTGKAKSHSLVRTFCIFIPIYFFKTILVKIHLDSVEKLMDWHCQELYLSTPSQAAYSLFHKTEFHKQQVHRTGSGAVEGGANFTKLPSSLEPSFLPCYVIHSVSLNNLIGFLRQQQVSQSKRGQSKIHSSKSSPTDPTHNT